MVSARAVSRPHAVSVWACFVFPDQPLVLVSTRVLFSDPPVCTACDAMVQLARDEAQFLYQRARTLPSRRVRPRVVRTLTGVLPQAPILVRKVDFASLQEAARASEATEEEEPPPAKRQRVSVPGVQVCSVHPG